LVSARIEALPSPIPLEPAPQAVPAPRIQTDLFAGPAPAAGPARAATVATGGFSSMPAGGAAAPVAPVRSAGFGDVEAAATAKPTPKIEISGPTVPVEILAKPHPTYTDEARRLGIEGEVVLRVRFTAAGRVEVLSLVRSLGHGLDERAAEAARRIHFRPALEQGRPVDFAALVHMTFQLAY
jgi:TonB family protein